MADRSDREFPQRRDPRRSQHWSEEEGRAHRHRNRQGPYYADHGNSDRWSENIENQSLEGGYDPYPQGREREDDFADFPPWRGRRYDNPHGPGGNRFDYDRARHGYAGRAPGYQSYSDRDLKRGAAEPFENGPHRGKGPKGYVRSDGRIAEDVNERLSDHPDLDASEIAVQVADGEVTLSGFVAARQDKRSAEDCADRVTGVRHVQNNLRVDPARFSGSQT